MTLRGVEETLDLSINYYIYFLFQIDNDRIWLLTFISKPHPSKMFDFVIPLNRDDLFEAATRNQYTVENVYNTRDLKIKLKVGNITKLYHRNVIARRKDSKTHIFAGL